MEEGMGAGSQHLGNETQAILPLMLDRLWLPPVFLLALSVVVDHNRR